MPKSDGVDGDHGVPGRGEVAGRGEVGGAFRLLLAANPLPMWVYDVETLRFLEVNDAAIAHYGYTRAEFLDMSIADIRPEEDRPRLGHRANWERAGDALCTG